MTTTKTQFNIAIAFAATERFYQIMRESIRRLVTLTRVFCIKLSQRNYLYYSIIRHFAPVIPDDCNKPCRLAYKVY